MGQLDMFMGVVALAGVTLMVVDSFSNILEDGGTVELIVKAATGGAAAYLGARQLFGAQ